MSLALTAVTYGECSFPDSLQIAAFARTAGGYVRHVGRASRFLVLLAAGALPAAGAATPPQVAFKQFPGDRQAIVVVDEAGRDAVELTRGKPTPSEFGSFSWSPDGSRLVYASEGLVGGDLYSVGADGGGLARLTADGGQRRSRLVSRRRAHRETSRVWLNHAR